MPDWNFQGSFAGGVASSGGVCSQGQAAPSLGRRWPKEAGLKMMLSLPTQTSGDMGSPEDHKTSCLFHKIKGMGKSPNGTQPLPSRKREETGSMQWRHGSAISQPHHRTLGDVGSSAMPNPLQHLQGGSQQVPAGAASPCCGDQVLTLLRQSGTHWGSWWSTSFLAGQRTRNMALGCNGQQYPKQRV